MWPDFGVVLLDGWQGRIAWRSPQAITLAGRNAGPGRRIKGLVAGCHHGETLTRCGSQLQAQYLGQTGPGETMILLRQGGPAVVTAHLKRLVGASSHHVRPRCCLAHQGQDQSRHCRHPRRSPRTVNKPPGAHLRKLGWKRARRQRRSRATCWDAEPGFPGSIRPHRAATSSGRPDPRCHSDPSATNAWRRCTGRAQQFQYRFNQRAVPKHQHLWMRAGSSAEPGDARPITRHSVGARRRGADARWACHEKAWPGSAGSQANGLLSSRRSSAAMRPCSSQTPGTSRCCVKQPSAKGWSAAGRPTR